VICRACVGLSMKGTLGVERGGGGGDWCGKDRGRRRVDIRCSKGSILLLEQSYVDGDAKGHSNLLKLSGAFGLRC